MPFGPAANNRFAHLIHLDRALNARVNPNLLQRVLHGQRIHHRRQHAHVIGLRAVHALRRTRNAAKDVTATNHQTNIEPGFFRSLHLTRQFSNKFRIDAVALIAHQHFARQFEQDALELGESHGRTGFRNIWQMNKRNNGVWPKPLAASGRPRKGKVA